MLVWPQLPDCPCAATKPCWSTQSETASAAHSSGLSELRSTAGVGSLLSGRFAIRSCISEQVSGVSGASKTVSPERISTESGSRECAFNWWSRLTTVLGAVCCFWPWLSSEGSPWYCCGLRFATLGESLSMTSSFLKAWFDFRWSFELTSIEDSFNFWSRLSDAHSQKRSQVDGLQPSR